MGIRSDQEGYRALEAREAEEGRRGVSLLAFLPPLHLSTPVGSSPEITEITEEGQEDG